MLPQNVCTFSVNDSVPTNPEQVLESGATVLGRDHQSKDKTSKERQYSNVLLELHRTLLQRFSIKKAGAKNVVKTVTRANTA